MTDAVPRTSQWARDLDRASPFERIVSLMAASRLLSGKAREEKKKLLCEAGWKVARRTYTYRRGNHVHEFWTNPENARVYMFDQAWQRYVAKLKRIEQGVCLGCVGKALGIRVIHTHVKRAKRSEST